MCSKPALCQRKYRLIFKLVVLVAGLEQKFVLFVYVFIIFGITVIYIYYIYIYIYINIY